ncbi:hypothetical protein N1851_015800 [Merluccius polli]|uniref:Alkylated DNA repair protein AlkB homologue 8 N-terminal domain-containing protein n=1 Tax=Merluccius polli TaxID=89951 RepID=A0AA47MSJ9_MERPO|nr:hypothetical protein N1851_015800 [Merluccius polli]
MNTGAPQTVLGLITGNDETSYRREAERLVEWCGDHNLALNTTKTKEVIIDFHMARHLSHSPLLIGGEEVSNFKFLGVTVADDLSWRTNITSDVGKAQQRLFYLRKLKRAKLPQGLMVNFHHCAVESVLTYGLLVWFSSCTRAEKETLHRVVKAAGRIIGKSLPEISTVFTSRCLRRVNNILQDQFHPAHHLFQRLPSG